ncbi:unnamed protein product [Rhizophagus irregularis]|nr:unnamed protein product [Rhizophagus irregularis]
MEGILEFKRTGLHHLRETLSAVKAKQITYYELGTLKSATQTKKGEPSSTKMVLREKRRMSYTEPDTDSDSDSKKLKKSKRVGSTSDIHLKSAESPQPAPKTPSQAPCDLTPLERTPNKRPLNKDEIQQYSEDISVICAFDKTISELTLEISTELANKLYFVRVTNPEVWISNLEKYINTALKNTGKEFKTAVLVEVPDELFQLYCENYNLIDRNPCMSRKIGEHKFIVNQISSIFKFYKATFLDLEFDWIESHACSAKLMKSATNSGIVKVDSKATRYFDDLDIWHIEVSGGPSNATDIYTVGDTIKTLRIDVLNLIRVLRNHLDCDIRLWTKIKVFCTQIIETQMTLYSLNMLPDGRYLSAELTTASIPFNFHGRHLYKAVFRMMVIFHDEITKQEELIGKINRSVLRSKGVTICYVLKIPEGMFDE